MSWWQQYLPVDSHGAESEGRLFKYHGQEMRAPAVMAGEGSDKDSVMLVRERLSRIYFNKQFFDYPLKINAGSLRKLGIAKVATFGVGYVGSRLRPVVPEKSLEDFLINRFGRPLYHQFFKEYTEKVWGCHAARSVPIGVRNASRAFRS